MIRIASFFVGIGLVAAASAMVLPEPRGWINNPAALCTKGHPVHRLPTDYDGLPPKAGYVRDHIVPRCLGGPDLRSNIQYQPLADARLKDARERTACEALCTGRAPLGTLRAQFHREYP